MVGVPRVRAVSVEFEREGDVVSRELRAVVPPDALADGHLPGQLVQPFDVGRKRRFRAGERRGKQELVVDQVDEPIPLSVVRDVGVHRGPGVLDDADGERGALVAALAALAASSVSSPLNPAQPASPAVPAAPMPARSRRRGSAAGPSV